jgi:hypothetical protein
MGYTHYWYLNNDADEEILKSKYAELLPIVKKITEESHIRLESSLSEEYIHFNGIEGDGHEDFLWFPGHRTKFNMVLGNQNFSFCKTARKDYDVVVVAILCAIQRIYGDELVKISSDGDMNGCDWEPGRALFEKVMTSN